MATLVVVIKMVVSVMGVVGLATVVGVMVRVAVVEGAGERGRGEGGSRE